MKYTITLSDDNWLTGEYLGMQFINGTAQTDIDFIADKARMKGFEVETAEEIKAPEGEKFKCPHCEKEYTKLEYLNSHIANKHPNGS